MNRLYMETRFEQLINNADEACDVVIKVSRCNKTAWNRVTNMFATVSIKPISTTTTTNFELKQSD